MTHLAGPHSAAVCPGILAGEAAIITSGWHRKLLKTPLYQALGVGPGFAKYQVATARMKRR
jgi:hypothetical protein